jgi:hypothetical protein
MAFVIFPINTVGLQISSSMQIWNNAPLACSLHGANEFGLQSAFVKGLRAEDMRLLATDPR